MENSGNHYRDNNPEQLKNEESTRGLFVKSMLERIDDAPEGDEKIVLSMALQYGLDSLSPGEVKKAWL